MTGYLAYMAGRILVSTVVVFLVTYIAKKYINLYLSVSLGFIILTAYRIIFTPFWIRHVVVDLLAVIIVISIFLLMEKKVAGNGNTKHANYNETRFKYCRNCGVSANIKQSEACLSCGFYPASGHNYCQECGKETSLGQALCMNCGFELLNQESLKIDKKQEYDGVAAIIGFLLPIVGLILYIVWNDNSPGKAKSAGYGALIGFSLGLIIFVLFFGYMFR